MKMYLIPFLSRALSIAIFSCLFAAVSVNAQVPVIDSSLTDSVVVDQPYSYTIEATNASIDTYGAPGLPSGLSRSSGVITGSVSQAGVYDITLFAQNADGFDQQTLVLTVSGAAITSSLNETAYVGEPYFYQITANNAPTSYLLFGLESFPGLSYDAATGVISGTPTAVTSGDIIVQAIDPNVTATDLLVLTVDPAPVGGAVPVITSALTVTKTKGVPFSYVIEATNSPFSFGAAGALPSGLSRSGDTISGTPTETGVFTIDISATNEVGTGSDTLVLTVEEPAPVITSVLTLGGEVDQSFFYQITADNTPLSFDAFGLDAISGLSIDTETGVISGTPTVSGDFDVTIEATNAAGSDTASLRIVVIPAADAGNGAVVKIITINGEDPLTNLVFDADTATLTIVAEVEPDVGETLESVFVRWNNPPATAGGASSIVAELLPVGPIPATGPITFTGTVKVGFSPTAREIGGGAIDLEVVATQRSAADVLSFGTSGPAMIEIAPLVELLFPSEDLVMKEISIGEVFASVKLGTNAFQTITATISGVGVIDTIIIDDSSDHPNGIFNFLAETSINFPGTYTVDIVAIDSLGNTTRMTQEIAIDNAATGPVVSIATPTPGFTNEVFTPAIFAWEQDGAPTIETNEGVVITTTYTYSITQVTEGLGYYPRNATGKNIIYNFLPGGASVAGNTIVDGRLPDLADSLSIVFPGESNGYGSSGAGVVDNGSDPGQPAQITLAAEFFQGDADLVSFKMFVNGADVTPGNGNLDRLAGPIDAAVIDYPASGSPAPGYYVVTAQVTDRSGNVTTSTPRGFEILPYEPLEISFRRLVGAGDDPSDPILIGDSATFVADVNPIDEIQSVEIFESNSGAKLGDASRVQIDGNSVYRSTIVFNEMGDFKVFAKATSFNGLTLSSAPVDILVFGGEFPEVEITSPLAGDTFTAGDTLTLRITATDADGAITTVEIFDGGTLLGTAVPSGVANEYIYNLPTSASDLGVHNFIARATDDRGNSTDSDVIVLGLTQGDVPVVELLEPSSGDSFQIGQPLLIRVTATDADGIIASVVARDISGYFGAFPLEGLILNATQNPGEYVVSPIPSAPEVVDLIITATDDDGNQVSTVPVQFTISSGIVPGVSIDSPLDGDGPFNLGDVITVEMTASDVDGSVTQVELFNGAASLGLASLTGADTYRFDYSASAAGLLNLRAQATDDTGNVGISNLVSVSVVTGDIPTVSFDDPADGTSYTLGDLIALEITADDADGFVTQVEIFHDQASLGFALWLGGDQYRYTIDTATAGIAPGTLNLSARATDNSGNAAFALLAVDLVQFAYSVRFTDPTTDPFTLESDSFEVGTHLFEVEVVGIDPTTLQSVTWYLDGTELASSQIVSGNLIYSQSITLKANGVVTAVAANSTGVEVEASVTVALDLANPLSDDADFVNYAYFQLTATEPTAAYVSSAVSQMDGTIDGQVAYLEALFESDDMDETEMIMMVYRTMTGEWPNDEELQAARDGALGGTEGAASQSGNIEQGGTQTFEFFYNAGDIVTVRVAADASNGDPLTDATLTINDPSGGFVAYSDDSFLGLDPLVVFTATEAGSYSAIVGGFSTLQSGDFTITSTSSNSGESSDASAEALVQFLIPEFEDRFNMTFPTTSAVSGLEATNLVKQLFKNKHGGVPSGQPLIRLADALTGSGSAIIYGEAFPGYSGDLSSFTAAFALDNERHSWDGDYSRDNYYKIPNQPINDVPLALMIAMFLSEDPTDAALAEYNGMTQAEAFEDILTDPRYYEQFTPSSVSSYIVMRLAELGVFTQSLRGPDDDADGDGQSNLIEIALGSNPVDSSDTASNPRTNIEDGNDFVVTFIRIQASEVPGDFIIYAECSADMGSWDHREDTTDVALLAADQSGVPEGYERVEIRIDMTVRPCQFIRLSIDLP